MWKRALIIGIVSLFLLIGLVIFLLIKFPRYPLFRGPIKFAAPLLQIIAPRILPVENPPPVTKIGNLEVLIDPVGGGQRILSITGQLIRVRLERYDPNSTLVSGQISVETTYKGTEIKFYAPLSEVGLIDDREGLYQSMGPQSLTEISSTPPVFIQCNVDFPIETNNTHKCSTIVLKRSL